MKIVNSLIVAASFSLSTLNAASFSWGISFGFGGCVQSPVYCPPPVIYSPVVYQPQVVVVPQPIVRHVVYHPPVVVVPQPIVCVSPVTTIYVGGHSHGHGHGRKR